jgi:hypothetical protein
MQSAPAIKALDKVASLAHAAEAVTLGGFLTAAGPLAKPIQRGPMTPWIIGAVAGLVEERSPKPRRKRRSSSFSPYRNNSARG